MNEKETIRQILEKTETIAVVGFSNSTHRAGFYIPEYLQRKGYKIIPVNPGVEEGLGEKAYPDLGSVPVPIDLVLIFRRPSAVPAVVEDAIEVGAKAVWMQPGAENLEAAEAAEAAGLKSVAGPCIAVAHRMYV